MDHTPTNSEIAEVFEQIANILERQGENQFKVRAYRNAVRPLESLSEPAADINARAGLRKIVGFGDAIVGKTQEILATGTCALYERLKAEDAAPVVPPEAGPGADKAEIEAPW